MKAKRISLTVALLALVSAAPAFAGQGGTAMTRAEPDPDKAEQLRDEAESLFSEPKQWKKAVRLLEQSAELRDAADPEAYDCLMYAGRIRAALGDFKGARQSLEKAAAQALARGGVVDGANALIDAAHAAAGQKDVVGAQALVDRAELLMQSPLLSVEQRTSLRSRIAA